jgi:hypothetical protein
MDAAKVVIILDLKQIVMSQNNRLPDKQQKFNKTNLHCLPLYRWS